MASCLLKLKQRQLAQKKLKKVQAISENFRLSSDGLTQPESKDRSPLRHSLFFAKYSLFLSSPPRVRRIDSGVNEAEAECSRLAPDIDEQTSKGGTPKAPRLHSRGENRTAGQENTRASKVGT